MRSTSYRAILLSSMIGLAASVAAADVIHLKNGGKVEGTLKRTDTGWLVMTGDKSVSVQTQDVDSIELMPATNPSGKVVNEHLASLRRSVENLNDLNEIIGRFQRFVDQNNEPAATADAKKDLAMWQDRQKQKMTKVGSHWVNQTDRTKLIDGAATDADTARQLMKQGRSKEAEPLLVEAIAVDPTNATAQYLTGLIRFEQEQMPAAHKAFDATAGIVPNHAPTLNNLGVVQWRQHQLIASLQSFDSAMLAAPVDKVIIDNVSVALQSLPNDLQKSPVTLRVIRHFNEQDQKLSEQMARDGMHRFGSLWVSDHDLDQIKSQEKQIQDKLDAMSGDFDHLKQRVDQLNSDISDDQTSMHRIESSSFVTDPQNGARVAVPYPSNYYDLQRDILKMTHERDANLGKLDALKKQAQDLQSNRPSIKSQGVMLIIGPEGAPIKVTAPQPAIAATQPVIH